MSTTPKRPVKAESKSSSKSKAGSFRKSLQRFFETQSLESLSKDSTSSLNVFGKSIALIVDQTSKNEVHPEIPNVVRNCIEFLSADENRMKEEGLFRVSGNALAIENFAKVFDCDFRIEVDFESFQKVSPHIVAGILKKYFRELPDPILSTRFYSTFLKVYKNPDLEQKKKNFHLLLQGLPSEARKILFYLLKFLSQISKFSDQNKMTPRNLATVWAPNLLGNNKKTPMDSQTLILDSGICTEIIEDIINDIDFFSQRKKSAKDDLTQNLNLEILKESHFSEFQVSGWLSTNYEDHFKKNYYQVKPSKLMVFSSEKDFNHSKPLGTLDLNKIQAKELDEYEFLIFSTEQSQKIVRVLAENEFECKLWICAINTCSKILKKISDEKSEETSQSSESIHQNSEMFQNLETKSQNSEGKSPIGEKIQILGKSKRVIKRSQSDEKSKKTSLFDQNFEEKLPKLHKKEKSSQNGDNFENYQDFDKFFSTEIKEKSSPKFFSLELFKHKEKGNNITGDIFDRKSSDSTWSEETKEQLELSSSSNSNSIFLGKFKSLKKTNSAVDLNQDSPTKLRKASFSDSCPSSNLFKNKQ